MEGPKITSDEIDLITVIKDFKNIVNRRKRLIYVIFGLGFFIGLLYYIVTPKTYQSRLFLSSTSLKGASFIIVMDDLVRHIKELNYNEASKLLNVDVEVIKEIKHLQVYSAENFATKEFSDLINIDQDSKDEEAKGEFVIEVYVTNNTILPIIERGLKYFLDNNEFVSVKNRQRKEGLKLLKNKIHKELSELDTLKYSLNDLYARKGAASLYINDPGNIHNDILELYRLEISTTTELENPDFTIIQGLVSYKKHHSPKLLSSMFVSMVLSGIICFLSIIFVEIRDRLS